MGSLNAKGRGKTFWARVQSLSLCSIALGISKIYEDEKRYELNSVHGLMKLIEKQGLVSLGHDNANYFYADYKQYASDESPSSAHLRNVLNGFLASKSSELNRFKMYRDKILAHGEFSVSRISLPSFDEMEQLYEFAKKFYYHVSDDYVGVGHANLDSNRRLRVALKAILGDLIDDPIKMEWEN